MIGPSRSLRSDPESDESKAALQRADVRLEVAAK